MATKARASARTGTTLWSIVWDLWTLFFWGLVAVFFWIVFLSILWDDLGFDQVAVLAWVITVPVTFLAAALVSWMYSRLFSWFKEWAERVEISWPGN